ncbi:helix-turn-helix domain-containing protein [Pseudoflavitalea rhizosphaerae]|uniref:helix-turn-helix domain-containing protein n=1 Tax=Pseudoflavitalea rhizosphaerae TaxID=1884793 RepID=UPI000F8F2C5C|nr:helix-turn-helix transcriptional regulator [Pseudoflavitalea rhizosphaerae]
MKIFHQNRLAVVLKELRIKNVTLAKGLGVTTGMVSRWCSNISQPTLPRLYEISEFLRVDQRDLLTSTIWPRDQLSPAEKLQKEEKEAKKIVRKKKK